MTSKRTRLVAIIGAAVLSLSLVVPAFAATSGSTPESLTIASTITLTAPSLVTYAGPTNDMAASVGPVTASSNGGFQIDLTVNAAAAFNITPDTRSLNTYVYSGLGDPNAVVTAPFFANNGSTVLVIAQNAGAASGTVSLVSHVNATGYAAGTWTGGLNFAAHP